MNKIGFIGFGNMGGTILRALLKAGAFSQENVIVFTRTRAKLNQFKAEYPKVIIADSLSSLGRDCSRVFICTGTREVKAVLSDLSTLLPPDAHIISITGVIEMKCLENVYKGKITKIMPTMLAEVGEGITLVYHNRLVQTGDREFICAAFQSIGTVKEIREDQLDLAADLTSCAPAFYSAILRNFTDSARKQGDFSIDEIRELVLGTCYGTLKLLVENQEDFNHLESKIATKGGISEEGIKILDSLLPEAFDKLLTVTLDKRQKSKKLMRDQFGMA